MVSLEVDSIGAIPIDLDDSLQASKVLRAIAAKATSGNLHRSEPLPAAGSNGPPYALIQWGLNNSPELKNLPHEGTAKIKRGSVCLIGGASDLFISLARNAEHDGWETGMTVLGSVPEPELTSLVEEKILALPKHIFTHPQYGTTMSMLDTELGCRLSVR